MKEHSSILYKNGEYEITNSLEVWQTLKMSVVLYWFGGFELAISFLISFITMNVLMVRLKTLSGSQANKKAISWCCVELFQSQLIS